MVLMAIIATTVVTLVRRVGTRSVGSILVALAVAFGHAPVAAAEPSIAVSPTPVPQGGTATISGNVPVTGTGSCAAGDPAQLTSTAALFPPDGFGPQAPRDAAGNFTATYVVPASTPVGSYRVTIRCGGGNVGIGATLDVSAPSSAKAAITVSPATAQPGDTVALAGVVPTTGTQRCAPGDSAQLTSTAAFFPPDGFGPPASRDATGRFNTTYKIPNTTPPGTYSVGVRCGGGNTGVSATLQVSAPTTTTTVPATSSPTTTAPTSTGKGTNRSVVWIVLGALVVALGAGAGVVVSRRRRAGS